MCVLNKFNKNQPKKWKRINGGLEAAFLIITTHYPSSKTIHMADWLEIYRNFPIQEICIFKMVDFPASYMSSPEIYLFFSPWFWRDKFNKYSGPAY